MWGHLQGCVAMTAGAQPGLWDVLPCTNKIKYICKHLAEGARLTTVPPTHSPPDCADGWTPLASKYYCVKVRHWKPSSNFMLSKVQVIVRELHICTFWLMYSRRQCWEQLYLICPNEQNRSLLHVQQKNTSANTGPFHNHENCNWEWSDSFTCTCMQAYSNDGTDISAQFSALSISHIILWENSVRCLCKFSFIQVIVIQDYISVRNWIWLGSLEDAALPLQKVSLVIT